VDVLRKVIEIMEAGMARFGCIGSTILWTAIGLMQSLPSPAADAIYGELEPGAISRSEQSGVQCELCRDHLFDPAMAPVRLPEGYRLISAAEYAKEDSSVAALLAKHPRYEGYAVGSLCFMSVDTFLVDGVRVHGDGPTAMAFWWAHADTTPGTQPDPSMKGRVQWLQLGSWYSSRGTDRDRIRSTDPMAEFVDVRVTRRGPHEWEMRLPLDREVVRATVRGDGVRVKRRSNGPGFMTVPFTGNSAGTFTVFTYFGHHHQEATGTWRASGRGVFHDAFGVPEESSVFGTFYQDGWQAKSGLYRFKH